MSSRLRKMGCAASRPWMADEHQPRATLSLEDENKNSELLSRPNYYAGSQSLKLAGDPAAPAPAEKVVLLGQSGVGKSSILRNLEAAGDGSMGPPPTPTLVTAFMQKTIHVVDMGCSVKLEIWDTAGQERFCAMAPLYYRGASAALIVYDVSSPSSFERARFWVAELMRTTSASSSPPPLLLILVGNKADLPESLHRVSASSAQAFADSHNIPLFFETSALTSANIPLLFHQLSKHLILARRFNL